MQTKYSWNSAEAAKRAVRSSGAATRGCGLVLCIAAAACASDPTKRSVPAELVPAPPGAAELAIEQAFSARLAAGSVRGKIPAGSVWRSAGTIEQGQVYDPSGFELVVLGKHAFEGHLVLDGGQFVGVYLPFERAFVPAKKVVPVSMGAIR